MDAYDNTQSQLLRTSLGRQPHIRAYLTALNDFNAGLIEWTTHSARYTRSPIAHWTVPDQIIHPADEAPDTRTHQVPTPPSQRKYGGQL